MAPHGPASPLLVADLHNNASTLMGLLTQALRGEQWLDAYLITAGLGQLVEDRLHGDAVLLHRAASYLRGRPARSARLTGITAAVCGAVMRLAAAPGKGRLARARDVLAALASELAGQVLAADDEPRDLMATVPDICAAIPGLSDDLVRMPACFHSFDQHPDDVRWLTRAFLLRYRVVDVPLCVVGVRTSGSYLAPLYAAALRAQGCRGVETLTYRPGRPFLRDERATLRAVARAGGLVLIADDPPASGSSLATTAQTVSAVGVPDSRIVFLLSLFNDDDELPPTLSRWSAVVQPWREWSIHRRSSAAPVSRALAEMADPGIEVAEVQPLKLPYTRGERSHVRALFAVRLLDRHTGNATLRHIVAEGAGLGYFGRQSLAAAIALPGHVPHVYGFADGLLYRDWLPSGEKPAPDTTLADVVAGYITARQRALPARAAGAEDLDDRDPVWEVAALLLSGQFGRFSVPARPLLLEPLMRRLLAHDHPTVLDGKTDHRHWLSDPATGGVRKVEFYQRTFGRLALACFDPVFDLAGAAADPPDLSFEALLRDAYLRASGQQVDPERWLLYRLAQLWRLRRAGDLDADQAGQRSAAAIHDYLAGRYLRDLPPAEGPLCAIDLDGVLECDGLGYPATSPTGVLALRALTAHGYRPVLASGRSMPEVRDRCAAFSLAGGVAEYGAAITRDDNPTDLRPPDARAVMDRVRDELSDCPGVALDPRYRYVVRARTSAGPVPARLLASLPALEDSRLRIVHGQGQTDIICTGIDKGSGLHALAERLSQAGCALAVGDTEMDLPLLERASLARAPRNARLGAGGARIRLTRGAYQAGLSDACAALLGHPPGRCPVCRPPTFSRRARAVLAVLDLRANGLASLSGGTVTASALLAASARW